MPSRVLTCGHRCSWFGVEQPGPRATLPQVHPTHSWVLPWGGGGAGMGAKGGCLQVRTRVHMRVAVCPLRSPACLLVHVLRTDGILAKLQLGGA